MIDFEDALAARIHAAGWPGVVTFLTIPAPPDDDGGPWRVVSYAPTSDENFVRPGFGIDIRYYDGCVEDAFADLADDRERYRTI